VTVTFGDGPGVEPRGHERGFGRRWRDTRSPTRQAVCRPAGRSSLSRRSAAELNAAVR